MDVKIAAMNKEDAFSLDNRPFSVFLEEEKEEEKVLLWFNGASANLRHSASVFRPPAALITRLATKLIQISKGLLILGNLSGILEIGFSR